MVVAFSTVRLRRCPRLKAQNLAGALWENIKFDSRHFADIKRLAMVGENKWQHGTATFCKPFTAATIRYFDHVNAAEARRWLGEW